MKTIVRIEFGSHLYGTNTEFSDHDFKAVHVPSGEDILLQRVKNSTGHQVIRPEREKNTPEDTDDESYSLQKYLLLLAEGQTVAIDMLFALNPIVTSALWEEIRENKDRLLTKRSTSFVGYCVTQASKYGIRGSRVHAAKLAVEYFQKMYDKFGPQAKVGEVSSDLPIGPHAFITAKVTSPHGHVETYYDCCNRKVGMKNTLKEALKMYSAIYEEYGERARQAETNQGIDWKALSHAVRVGHEALSLLSTGNISFPLYNKDHLLEIKLGKLPYKEVAKEIEDLLDTVKQAESMSTLRETPDYDYINGLVIREYGREVVDWLR